MSGGTRRRARWWNDPLLLIAVLALSIFWTSHRFFIAGRFQSRDGVPLLMAQRMPATETVIHELRRAIPDNIALPVVVDDDVNTAMASPPRSPFATRLVAPYAAWAHGHILFLHHSNHGIDHLESLVLGYVTRNIPVDAVVLDAGWWHPSHVFVPHPQRYPSGFQNPAEGAITEPPKIVLWVSAIIPSSSLAYVEGRKRGYFISRNVSDIHDVHVVTWKRADGPAISGGLLDFTNPDAVAWHLQMLTSLLEMNPAVMGFRCAGVDALLHDVRDAFGAIGYISEEWYRKLYYRYFLDAGRHVRGGNFLMIGRAVDSFNQYHFKEFAPRDSLFAAWVGDHPFTFGGMRESLMNVIHSGYRCFVNVGSMIGGSFLGLERSMGELDGWASAQLVAAVGGDEAAGEFVQAQVQYVATEELPRQRLLHPLLNNDPPLGNDGDIVRQYWLLSTNAPPQEEEKAVSDVETGLRRCRRRELYQRWLQNSALLPFLSNGGLVEMHLPWEYDSMASNCDDFTGVEHKKSVETLYRALVAEHRSLALYYMASSADSLSDFFDSKYHLETPYAARDDTAAAAGGSRKGIPFCPIEPLSRRRISFEEPYDHISWAMRIGRDLLVFPVVHSFGMSTAFMIPPSNDIAPETYIAKKLDLVKFRSPSADPSSASSSEWILLHDPAVTVCRVVFHGSSNALAPQLEFVNTSALQLPSPNQLPLVLRRRDAMIPIVQEILHPSRFASSGIKSASHMSHAVIFTVDGPSVPFYSATTPTSLLDADTAFPAAKVEVTVANHLWNAEIIFLSEADETAGRGNEQDRNSDEVDLKEDAFEWASHTRSVVGFSWWTSSASLVAHPICRCCVSTSGGTCDTWHVCDTLLNHTVGLDGSALLHTRHFVGGLSEWLLKGYADSGDDDRIPSGSCATQASRERRAVVMVLAPRTENSARCECSKMSQD